MNRPWSFWSLGPHLVVLTKDEIVWANRFGDLRNEDAQSVGLKPYYSDLDGCVTSDRIGVRGELAFSKFLGKSTELGELKTLDVGGYEVRTGSPPKNGWAYSTLKVYKGDPDNLKVVMVAQETNEDLSRYYIVGWVISGEVKKSIYWCGLSQRKREGWFVPHYALRPFYGNGQEAPR